MNMKEIESLYENQEFDAALDAANASLAQEPANKDLLYIKARCLFELSLRTEDQEHSTAQIKEAYALCSEVLAIDPAHNGALSYRAYIGVYCYYIEGQEEQTISDCTALINQAKDVSVTRYLEWRSQAYIRQQHPAAALEDLQRIISEAGNFYPNDQPQRNELLSATYFSMARILETITGDIPAALEQYRQSFSHSPYQSRFLPVAKLALDHGDYDLAASILDILPTSLEDVSDEFVELLETIKQLYHSSNPVPPKVALMYCTSTAAFPDIVLTAEDETDVTLQQVSLGKKLMQQFPDEAYYCNYTGRALFRAGQYADALPYTEKGIAIRPYPMTVARWAYAKYKTTGSFPETYPPAVHDTPYDWYEAGVAFGEWEAKGKQAVKQWELMLDYLYGNAIKLYKAYWFENSGSAKAHHPHHFAMCCNNYGINLSRLGRYEEAVEIHTIGYNISPFWEQLDSRAYACRDAGKYDQAAEDWAALLEYSNMLEPVKLAATYNLLIDLWMSNLNNHEKAAYWYDQFMEVYDGGLSDEIAQLPADEQEAAQQQVNEITTSRGLIQGSPGDLPQRIRLLEKHLEQYPDDSNGYFNLMQLYYENKQYEHCIGCATSRLSLGGLEEIPIYSQARIYYFRGRAYIHTRNFEKGMQDMLLVQQLTAGDSQTVDSDLFNIYGYLAEAALGLGDYKAAASYATKSLEINDSNTWKWDQVTANIALIRATALKNDGQQKEAVRILKEILERVPDRQEAAQKLKEWKSRWSFF
jgi:tetratricopeptide (TPR) repeat protein